MTGVLPDNGLGSAVGDPPAGGLAAQGAGYDHLMLLGPAMAGYFSTPSAMPGALHDDRCLALTCATFGGCRQGD